MMYTRRMAWAWPGCVTLGLSLVTGCLNGPPTPGLTEPVSARHAGTVMLSAGDTSVEVMEPNDPYRYNRGVRFTPVAAVLNACVAGHEYLYNPVKHDPVDDHGGLASEFDLVIPDSSAELMPPGYNEARVGEGFLKIGVGVLRKQKGQYSLFQHPELIQPAVTKVRWTRSKAEFTQVCAGTNGYAYELAATVSVQPGKITVEWTLANTGAKPFATRQYTHNFFRFDENDVGPGYVLSFPYDFTATGLEAGQEQRGRDIHFLAPIPRWINAVVPYPVTQGVPNVCELRHTDAGLGVRCETSRPGLRMDIHARAAYIAPEQLIMISLAPAERQTWTRTYQFIQGHAAGRGN